MPTRNVVLTDRQVDLIARLVDTGQYQNASEVLRDGIRLIEQRETENKARVEALRAAIQVGDADVAAGRSKALKGPSLKRHLKSLTKAATVGRARVRRRK